MEVKLKRDGWHRRIQEYVFQDPPRFNNLCPYFWLTNFCILVTFIIPIVPLWHLMCFTGRAIDRFFDAASALVYKQICEPIQLRSSMEMTDDDRIKAWTLSKRYSSEEWRDGEFFMYDYYGKESPYLMNSKLKEKYRKKFETWKNNTPDWEQIILKLREDRRAKYEQLREQREAEAQRRIEEESARYAAEQKAKQRRQAMFTSIVKYTKWLGYLLLVAAAGVTLYGVYKLVNYAIDHFYYEKFIHALMIIGVCLGIVVIVILMVWFFRSVVFQAISCLFDSKIMCAFARGCVWICMKTIVPVGIKVGSFLGFFWEYLKVAKKDYCPAINWEEEQKKS